MTRVWMPVGLFLLLFSAGRAQAQAAGPGVQGGSLRAAVQARLDAIAMADVTGAVSVGSVSSPSGAMTWFGTAPYVVPGVRIAAGRLFLGAGLGWVGYSYTKCTGRGCDDEETHSWGGFTLTPTATYDVLADGAASLYVGGWMNLALFGGESVTTREPGTTETVEEDGFYGWGLDAVAGIRGDITGGLGLGAELGWGFLAASNGSDDSIFVQGILGSIVLEASVDL